MDSKLPMRKLCIPKLVAVTLTTLGIVALDAHAQPSGLPQPTPSSPQSQSSSLPGEGTVVRGRVISQGLPVPAVAVNVFNPAVGNSGYSYTSSDGMYYLRDIPPGDYDLRVWVTPKQPVVYKITVTSPLTDIAPIAIGDKTKTPQKDELAPKLSDLFYRIAKLSIALSGRDMTDAFGETLVLGGNIFFGLQLWNSNDCELQPIWRDFLNADQQRFTKIMGDGFAEIVDVIRATCPGDGQVAAKRLAEKIYDRVSGGIKQPWYSRFKELGTVRAFQEIQLKAMYPSFQSSVALAEQYGLRSERAVALMYDIEQSDKGFAKDSALRQQILTEFQAMERKGEPPSEVQRMRVIAGRVSGVAPELFRRSYLAKRQTIANGSGVVGGLKFDLDDFGIGLKDFRTGDSIAARTK